MSNTEQLMRKYPILSAAWDECTMIWKGVEQDGTVHKFNRKAMKKIVKSEQIKVKTGTRRWTKGRRRKVTILR